VPHAIDERPWHPPVTRVREDGSGGAPAVGERIRRRRSIQFRKQERRRGVVILRHIASIQTQATLGREEARKTVRVLQLPLADEAVVTRVALEIEADEDLRAVLRCLHRWRLARIHFAAPIDADEESIRIVRRCGIQELLDPAVVGQVRRQRRAEPCADAFA
jgi:hypothetical protein